jgi:hypothetical protein
MAANCSGLAVAAGRSGTGGAAPLVGWAILEWSMPGMFA